MNTNFRSLSAAALIALMGALAASPALADKPEWAGGGHGQRGDGPHGRDAQRRSDQDDRRGRDDQRQYRDDDRRREDDRRQGDRHGHTTVNVNIAPGRYFDDRQRHDARQWYGDEYRNGHCPPGLARKHNGCMPPGQARRWAVGRPLPSDITYYPVPQQVVVQLGVPPAGYRYVRVAGDIVLLAVGTRMVVDAITDLGRGF